MSLNNKHRHLHVKIKALWSSNKRNPKMVKPMYIVMTLKLILLTCQNNVTNYSAKLFYSNSAIIFSSLLSISTTFSDFVIASF